MGCKLYPRSRLRCLRSGGPDTATLKHSPGESGVYVLEEWEIHFILIEINLSALFICAPAQGPIYTSYISWKKSGYDVHVKGYWFEDSARAVFSCTALKGDVRAAVVRDVSGVDGWVVLPCVFTERSDGIVETGTSGGR